MGMSHPMRVRGLKLKACVAYVAPARVAPHAGAWIEISSPSTSARAAVVAPHAGAWIEMVNIFTSASVTFVAPHAGAWIEMVNIFTSASVTFVAPHAGAWIEIRFGVFFAFSMFCRTPCGCVD